MYTKTLILYSYFLCWFLWDYQTILFMCSLLPGSYMIQLKKKKKKLCDSFAIHVHSSSPIIIVIDDNFFNNSFKK